jgi:hypothetical protein
MRKIFLVTLSSVLLFLIASNFISCSKPTSTPPVATCADKAIVITGTTTNSSSPTATDGTVSVSATGSTGFTYSNNGGAFQSAGTFTSLAAGTYTISAKDDAGCTSTKSFTVLATGCPSISVTTLNVASDKCSNNTGKITVTASGSTGFSYTINGTTYQTSNIFTALATGNYTVGVKDANGCVNSAAAFVNIAPAGPLFSNVKALMLANCAYAGCHVGATPQSGIDLSVDCTIVAQSGRIKARSVDAITSVMPPTGAMSALDKQKITDWINAGGLHSN